MIGQYDQFSALIGQYDQFSPAEGRPGPRLLVRGSRPRLGEDCPRSEAEECKLLEAETEASSELTSSWSPGSGGT